MTSLFDAVDALVARSDDLPAPALRKKLRLAEGLTQPQVAEVLGVDRVQVARWEREHRRQNPRQPHRAAYARLLDQLAEKYPEVVEEAFVA